jgi:hypothetical protein
VGESQKNGDDPDGSYLGETFGLVCSNNIQSTVIGTTTKEISLTLVFHSLRHTLVMP